MQTYTKEALDKRRAALSPEKQALLHKRLRGEGDVGELIAIPRRPDDGPAPLSFSQERLWFLFEWEPESPVYNEAKINRVRGQLDVHALERAYLEIARRHEILRTTYQVVDGQPVQVVHPAVSWSLPVVDLSRLPTAVREAEVQRLVREETHRPFDLRRDLPWRVVLMRLAEEEHVIVTTQHHISCDGWSIEIRTEEFATLYVAFVAGKPSPLPELPIQYADFACWQRERLKGTVLEGLLAYWREQLAGLTPLELPIDRPRPPMRTSNGATQRVALPVALTEALTELGRRERVTSFVVYLAAFKALLARYTGQTDIATGAIAAHREQPGLEKVMGFFMETIVLRTDLSGNPTFRELLHRVHQVTQGAHIHKDLPFEHLIADLKHKRDPSRTPLVQVLFDWQDWQSLFPQQPAALPGLNLAMGGSRVPTSTAKFDLTLFVMREGGNLVCDWEYNTDLYDGDTITRMTGHFQTLLQAAVTDPDVRLSDLPLLAEAEREQMLLEWNATETAYPRARNFHELFEEQVARTPDSIGLVCQDQQLTYAQINVRANQLAHYLVEKGNDPDELIAVLVDRGIDFITSLLAIFKAGDAFLPLDPQYPTTRLATLLQDSQCTRVLSTAGFAPRLAEAFSLLQGDSLPEVIMLKELEYHTLSADNLSLCCHPNDLAYVMFTSGSTGKPKGVMVEQGGMLNHIRAKIDDLQITSSGIVCQNGPSCFDIITWQCIAALLVGGRVHIVPDAPARDPVQLLQIVENSAVTVLQVVPAMLQQLIYVARESHPKLASLRWMVPTGDALPTELCRQWLDLYPSIPLLNTYGSTECSDDQCHIAIRESPPPDCPLPIASIGRPTGNMQVYILDRYLNPVPIGVSGELYIGGVGVGRGYLNRPDLTAERFIPNPFSPDGGEARGGTRLYRTGDLARYLPDGSIEFLGRIDFQVKIRGFRIELGEIESVLLQHPAVQEMVVVASDGAEAGAGKRDDKHLVAYVVPDDGREPSVSELRRFLREKLPEYMIPATFVTLETLPLTLSGKVNRKALPEPEGLRPDLETVYATPRSEVERAIATIWQEQLGIEQVGIHDDFFELGGDSLLVMRLLNHVNETFEVRIPLQRFFEDPTVAGIAELVEVDKNQAVTDEMSIAERLRSVFPTEREGVLEAYLRQKVAHSLGVEVEQLPTNGNLAEFDLELVTADLLQSLEQDLELQLRMYEITARSSIRDWAHYVLMELDQRSDLAELEYELTEDMDWPVAGDHLSSGQVQVDKKQLSVNLDRLSGEEVTAMLGELLAEREKSGR